MTTGKGQFPTEWAKFIRESREELGLTQSDFAKRFGIGSGKGKNSGKSVVHFYETGRVKSPHPDNKRKLTQKINRALEKKRAA